MPRIARVVIPNIPHHVVQRGNRNMLVFFGDEDKKLYLILLKREMHRFGIKIWSYCLMDNHVHLIAVPPSSEALAYGLGNAHRHYTRAINFRQGWKGHLWQGRFFSYPMDEKYLYAAVRYVEQNPVKAGMVKKAEDYLWSSARSRVNKETNPVLSDFFMMDQIQNWSEFLETQAQGEKDRIERHMRTGRPFGSNDFIQKIEQISGKFLIG